MPYRLYSVRLYSWLGRSKRGALLYFYGRKWNMSNNVCFFSLFSGELVVHEGRNVQGVNLVIFVSISQQIRYVINCDMSGDIE